MRKAVLVWATLSIVALAGVAACGGNTGGQGGAGGEGGGGAGGGGPAPCADAPLSCPVGETCWFVQGDEFGCLPSGAASEGEACSPLVGQPTCGDALLCVKKSGADGGVCTKLCDASTGDPCGDAACIPVQLASGAQTHVCQ